MLLSPRLLISLDVTHGGAAAVFLSSHLHFTLIHAPWVMRRQLMKSTVHIQASSTKDLKHIHRRSSNLKVKRFLAVSGAKRFLTVETSPWCKHRHTFHCKKTLSSKNQSLSEWHPQQLEQPQRISGNAIYLPFGAVAFSGGFLSWIVGTCSRS